MRVGVVYEVIPDSECLICGHIWTAIIESDQIVWPDGNVDIKYVEKIECPACHRMTLVQREKMSILNKILKEFPNYPFMKVQGLDDAIIGLDEDSMRLVYSIKKSIDILIKSGEDEESVIDTLYNDIIGMPPTKGFAIWVTDNL